MTREVLLRKVSRLQVYLEALRPHAGKTAREVADDPYEIERLLELLVQVAVDIVTHELADRGIVPATYRKAFLRAGQEGLLPERLADSLADAAGLRNVLAHMYEEIDHEIVAASIGRAIRDFTRLVEVYQGRLEEEG